MKKRLAALLMVPAVTAGIVATAAAPAQAADHYITNFQCSNGFTANMNVRSSWSATEQVFYIYNVTYSSSIVADRVQLSNFDGTVLAMGGSTSTKNDVPKKVNNDYPAIRTPQNGLVLSVWNDGTTCSDPTGSTSLLP